jgi:hypothetical protein
MLFVLEFLCIMNFLDLKLHYGNFVAISSKKVIIFENFPKIGSISKNAIK